VKQFKILLYILAVFAAFYSIPFQNEAVRRSVYEALMMAQEYARQHVLLCLVPAFFIAGGIAVFVSQASVTRYFGAQAKKWLAYGVASVSGTILAVCSCTVLPLFAGIYTRGAGLGPATTFLYSGPAINVLAIILTARVLGLKLGIARALGAILFSVVIGLLMHFIFRKEERARGESAPGLTMDEQGARPLWKTAVYFGLMVAILVFANWGKPTSVTVELVDGSRIEGIRTGETGTEFRLKTQSNGESSLTVEKSRIAGITYSPSFYTTIYNVRFFIALAFLIGLIFVLTAWFKRPELREWTGSTWSYAKMILPLLFAGVLVAGFLLGRPGHPALIPERWISSSVGGNSWLSNIVASVAGALMYFATLTEVPILQGLLGAGMGDGPALALLLAGPALSLPNMLVIRQVLGTKKTLVFVVLVCLMATVAGKIFGLLVEE
jgi:uncharacterized membrane protein YraQ (UPF0718 family)